MKKKHDVMVWDGRGKEVRKFHSRCSLLSRGFVTRRRYSVHVEGDGMRKKERERRKRRPRGNGGWGKEREKGWEEEVFEIRFFCQVM